MTGLLDGLEPGALDSIVAGTKKGASGDTTDSISVRSAAISLKRIADALTGNDPGALDIFQDAGAEFRKGWER